MRCGFRCIRRGSRRASSISPNGARICLYRLRRQVELTADRALIDLLNEVSAYPAPADRSGKTPDVEHEIAVPFRIKTSAGVLSFFSMTTVFGTPVDVMLSELALELFFPADDDTASAVQRLAASASYGELAKLYPGRSAARQ